MNLLALQTAAYLIFMAEPLTRHQQHIITMLESNPAWFIQCSNHYGQQSIRSPSMEIILFTKRTLNTLESEGLIKKVSQNRYELT